MPKSAAHSAASVRCVVSAASVPCVVPALAPSPAAAAQSMTAAQTAKTVAGRLRPRQLRPKCLWRWKRGWQLRKRLCISSVRTVSGSTPDVSAAPTSELPSPLGPPTVLSEDEHKEFTDKFEPRFRAQGHYLFRDIFTSPGIAWELLRIFPRELLKKFLARTCTATRRTLSRHGPRSSRRRPEVSMPQVRPTRMRAGTNASSCTKSCGHSEKGPRGGLRWFTLVLVVLFCVCLLVLRFGLPPCLNP